MSNDRPTGPPRVRRGAPIRRPHPGRTLVALVLVVVAVFAAVGAGSIWSSARWAPGLALDLEGGTQVVLTPRSVDGGAVPAEQVQRAAEIIRQRVDATGLSETEVQVQGGQNISVSIPGEATRQQLDLISQSAQLRMRVVLFAQPVQPGAAPEPSPSVEPSGEATPGDGASATPTGEDGAPAATPTPTQSADGAAAPAALQAATTPPAEPAPAATTTPPSLADIATPTPTPGPGQPSTVPTPSPTDASDLAWRDIPEVAQIFAALDCSDPAQRSGGIVDDPSKPLVTCDQDGTYKYVLGPAELEGTDLVSASAAQATNNQGFTTGAWVVRLQFDSAGAERFSTLTTRISTLEPPRNQFAAVLDGLVVTAPTVDQRFGADVDIEGNFTQASADALAQQLQFGALPVSFTVQTEDQISATLGADQLRNGLIAGAVGLVLVVAYMLVQYRALGLVTIASLVIAAALTYGVLLLLSWLQGYRLSLAGVAGLIVAIGVTADSFILFFERVRDEIRDGRILSSAVEAGWRRARRTILVSDAVSLLSAVVLYVLAVGNVRGFAYTLGITTIIDLVVVVLFTHPVVAVLAKTKFFGGGHKLSGFDPEHLGSVVARHALHRGEHRPTVAEMRRAEREREKARSGGGAGESSSEDRNDANGDES
ncbi:protein translocase subunit SecD [Kineococcus sp. TBRC 1896]|uniref:Protein translocase subunit SecD n=1 Tax=Kineococcus mangrovi TaxID=1660183 RepID=A0ABV4I2L5_9ACTN